MFQRRGAETYEGETTRPQNTKNADSASHGNVAANKYKGISQRGTVVRLDGQRTTGAQNKIPVTKKLAAWTSCHHGDRTPNSNTAGTCHAINATTRASQPTTRWAGTRRR